MPPRTPGRLTLREAAELAGFARPNTIRDLWLATEDQRNALAHAYDNVGRATIDEAEFRRVLAERDAKRVGNWRRANMVKATATRLGIPLKVYTALRDRAAHQGVPIREFLDTHGLEVEGLTVEAVEAVEVTAAAPAGDAEHSAPAEAPAPAKKSAKKSIKASS